ncbi:ankyrin [Wilcoxina mikolae CBS 423.85]|nr:ankyrin [Wilcoxina mikolae CBS 423.85]
MAQQQTLPLYKQCLGAFAQLIDLAENTDHEDLAQHLSETKDPSTIAPSVREDYGRLRVWAENVGAHRTGRVSLDHRLREATRMKNMVLDLLEDLRSALQEAVDIISGDVDSSSSEAGSWPIGLSTSLGEGDEEGEEGRQGPQAEVESTPPDNISNPPLEESLTDITHIITCLYKFSIATRNPTPRDRLEKCSSIDVSYFETFDIQHAAEKFPSLDTNHYLIQRLGNANTRRRQLLRYHEQHHEKIVGHGSPAPEADTKERDQSDSASAIYTIAQTQTDTTVSTYVPPPPVAAEDSWTAASFDFSDTRSEGEFSQTSYASSTGGMGSLRVPDPPNDDAFDGMPFQCTYCYTLTVHDNRRTWVRHVFRDLRPFICTFENCQRSEYLFASRHEWFEHERAVHRREWFCTSCNQSMISKDEYQQHLQRQHGGQFTSAQLPLLVERGERPMESDQSCPLCKEMYAPRRLQSHLGQHMQQIALFVLPGAAEDDEDDEDAKGAEKASGSQGASSSDSGKGDADADEASHGDDGDQGDPSTDLPDPEVVFDAKKSRELYDAAEKGDENTVKRLLKDRTVDVNIVGGIGGKTPLIIAAEKGHEGVVKMLLSRKDLDYDKLNERRETALYVAARANHVRVLRMLLEKGSNVNGISGSWTALSIACYCGCEDAVRILLEREDIDVNMGAGKTLTPISLAAEKGYESIVRLLLERKDVDRKDVDVNSKDNNGRTPLSQAKLWGNLDVIQLLKDHGVIE